jgi:hypothetical protein
MVHLRTKSSVHRTRILYVLHCDCGKHGAISVHHAWGKNVVVDEDVDVEDKIKCELDYFEDDLSKEKSHL